MSLTDLSKDGGTSEILDVLGPYIQHLTALSDDDDGYCLIRSNFPAGVVVPVHSHPDRETFYILAGELQGYGTITGLRSSLATSLMCPAVSSTPGETCLARPYHC